MAELRTLVSYAEAHNHPPRAMLVCAGEIDLSNIHCLKWALAAAMDTGVTVLEVDLQEVDYLDSSGILALLEAHRELVAVGRDMHLHAGPRIVRLFELLGLDNVVCIQRSDDGGLNSADCLALDRLASGRETDWPAGLHGASPFSVPRVPSRGYRE